MTAPAAKFDVMEVVWYDGELATVVGRDLAADGLSYIYDVRLDDNDKLVETTEAHLTDEEPDDGEVH